MPKTTYDIFAARKPAKHILNAIPQPCHYKPSDYGLSDALTGRGVRIAVLDSGAVDHPDIKNFADFVDVTDDGQGAKDKHGHATMMAGVIGAHNKDNVTGISPSSDLLYAKVVNNDGVGTSSSIVAGLLWAIVKRADVVLMSLSSTEDNSVLADAVRKAYDQGICVIASKAHDDARPEYPAKYDEVLAVGSMPKESRARKFRTKLAGEVDLVLPGYDLYTTYLSAKYTRASGASFTAALAAGLCSLLIERNRKNGGSRVLVREIYSELCELRYLGERGKA